MQKPLPDDVLEKLDKAGLYADPDGRVDWRDNGSEHPKNWSVGKKVLDTGIITLFVTVSGFIGNVGTSVAHEAAKDFEIGSVLANIAFASMFFYGQGFGGLLLPPYTESFGRKNINIFASAGYAIACIVVGVPQSLPAVFVGRFCMGFLSALPTVVGSGSIEDMWGVRARIWAIDVWIKGSIIGIALGPCFATYVSTSSLHWPWVFHISALLMGGVCLTCFFAHESRPSVLLDRHMKAIRKSTNCEDLWTDNKDKVPDIRTFTHTMLIRPARFFFTEPIITAVSIMSAVVFGSVYLQTEGLSVTYEAFGFNEREASLVFFAWIIGLVLTIPLRLNDWRLVSRRLRKKEEVRPEDKINGLYVASPVLAVALWWFSWTVPPVGKSISPYVSLAAVVLVGACTNEFDGILQGYLTDSYATYAASANAPLAALRAALSGSFPIFGRQMFSNLGSNLAGTVLAIIATIFCFITFWFYKRAAITRENSKFAVHVEKVEDEKGDNEDATSS
ncbi:hypothetical protein PMZ80_001268 [Knufia obscura]|uniref:Major facilitator superfamily (MFS) profile domain-containing protein n=1 Tax=Knufia obscura TaxID=1635080 RepID=A0ABR0S2T4_9EURO|nr:hypothetical protein PMZ80_001268 [Knufia obscura]